MITDYIARERANEMPSNVQKLAASSKQVNSLAEYSTLLKIGFPIFHILPPSKRPHRIRGGVSSNNHMNEKGMLACTEANLSHKWRR